MNEKTDSPILTHEQLQILAGWYEGGPAWYRHRNFEGLYNENEFELMRYMAEELLERRAKDNA